VSEPRNHSAADYRDFAAELCVHFETMTDDFEVPSEDFQKFVLCFGTGSHAMHQVAAALAVAQTGRVFAAHANARVALECAIAAQWIVVHPDGFDRYQQLLAHQKTRLITGLHKVDMLPGGNESYWALLKGLEERDARNQTTEAIFSSLIPHGQALYAIYRQLCQATHPSDWVADAYFASPDGKLHLRGNADIGDEDGTFLYYPLALCAIFAVGALESLRVGTPHLGWLDAKSIELIGEGCMLKPRPV